MLEQFPGLDPLAFRKKMLMGDYEWLYNLWRVAQQRLKAQREELEKDNPEMKSSPEDWDSQLSEKWRPKKNRAP